MLETESDFEIETFMHGAFKNTVALLNAPLDEACGAQLPTGMRNPLAPDPKVDGPAPPGKRRRRKQDTVWGKRPTSVREWPASSSTATSAASVIVGAQNI